MRDAIDIARTVARAIEARASTSADIAAASVQLPARVFDEIHAKHQRDGLLLVSQTDAKSFRLHGVLFERAA